MSKRNFNSFKAVTNQCQLNEEGIGAKFSSVTLREKWLPLEVRSLFLSSKEAFVLGGKARDEN